MKKEDLEKMLMEVVLQKLWEGCYGREGSPSCSA